MNYILSTCKTIFLSARKFFNRNSWIEEYHVESDIETIHTLIEDGIVTSTIPHQPIGRGIASFIGNGPFEKVINGNEIIIRTPSHSEELLITPYKIVYTRKHKRMDGTNKFRIVVTRNPLCYNPKASNITPGYMKDFMQRYIQVFKKYHESTIKVVL